MEDQLVSFEIAKLAKEKGFDEVCLDTYNDKGILQNRYNIDICDIEDENNLKDRFEVINSILEDFCTAPTQSLLQKWLREKHKLHINMAALSEDCFSFMLEKLDDGGTTLCGGHLGRINYKTYEEALEKGLYETLNILS